MFHAIYEYHVGVVQACNSYFLGVFPPDMVRASGFLSVGVSEPSPYCLCSLSETFVIRAIILINIVQKGNFGVSSHPNRLITVFSWIRCSSLSSVLADLP